MIVDYKNAVWNIEIESIFLNVIATGCFIASLEGNTQLLMAGALFLIVDAIKFPYPNILDITDEVDDDRGGDDLST